MGLSRFIAPRIVDSWQSVLQAFRDVQQALDRATRSSYVQGLAVQDLQLASPGFYRVSPPLLGIRATIPRASEDNAAERISVSIEGTLGSITIFAPPGQTIAGNATATFSANGLIELYSNGVNGWVLIQQLPSESPIGTADVLLGVANASFPNGRIVTASTEITPSIAVPNVASWALNAASVTFAKLQNLTGLSVLGRATNSTGVMAAITAGGAGQYLRENAAATSLEWADPASASIINTGGQFVRAALTGDVTAAQGLNATAFRSFASKTVLANASSIAAIPSDLAGTAAFQHLRVNSANTGLEWSVLTSGDFPAGTIPLGSLATQASDTFVGNVSGAVQSPIAVALSSLAGAGLVFGAHTLDVTAGAGASLVVSANDIQRAALTGAVTAAQDSNTTAFGVLAAKSVLANATNASAVPAALAGTAAFQHLRVNAANTALEWSVLTTAEFPAASVPLTALATLPTLNQVLTAGNATSGKNIVITAADATIFGTDPGGTAQVRSSATIDHVAPSWTGTFAGAPGFSVSATQFNFVTSGAAKNVLFGGGGLQLTRVAAIPTAPTVAGGVIWSKTENASARLLFTNLTTAAASSDYPLDSAAASTRAVASIVTNSTGSLGITDFYTIPANTLAVGSAWGFRASFTITRGATLTASGVSAQINCGGSLSTYVTPIFITTGAGLVHVEGMFTVTAIGAAGTAFANIWLVGDTGIAATGFNMQATGFTAAFAINTTIANTLTGSAAMSVAVANLSLQAAGGYIYRIF